jgi:methylmalonyl-CoA/ethylmalonyl-CoA epimerase
LGHFLHHVGVVCPSERHALRLMRVLGLDERSRGEVPEYEAVCIFAAGTHGSAVELVIPRGGKLAEFNGGAGGLHHVAIAVPSLTALTDELSRRNVQLLERKPVQGAENFICNFLPPIFSGGVIVEFIELNDPVPDRPPSS